MKTADGFKQLLSELKNNSNIELQRAVVGMPTNIILKKVILDDNEFRLSDEIIKFYDYVSVVNLYWVCTLDRNLNIEKFHKDDSKIQGEIKINALSEMVLFDSNLDDSFWTANFDENSFEELKRFRIFDKATEYMKVGFIIEDNEMTSDLYFLKHEASGLSTVPLGFKKYTEKMIEFKGFSGWRENVIHPEGDENKRMMHYLKQVFNQKT